MNLAGIRRIALRFHDGQLDHEGRPYVAHLDAVASRVEEAGGTTQQQMAALLHGVIEHTNTTLGQLAQLGIRPRLLAMIDALTQRPEHQEIHLKRVLACPPALIVKRSDLIEGSARKELDWYRRRGYATALAFLDVATSSQPDSGSLISSISDERGHNWWYAVSSVGLLRSHDAVPALIAAIEREPARPTAVTAASSERTYHLRSTLSSILTDSDRWATDPPLSLWVPLLEQLEQHGHPELRHIGIQLLGRLREPDRASSFIRALRDPEPRVSGAAAWAAGCTHASEVYEPLVAMMLDDEIVDWQRGPAVSGLGELGDPRAAEHLVTMLGAHYAANAEAAARSLVKLRVPDVLPQIRDHLVSAARGREKAAWVLGELRDVEAVQTRASRLNERPAQLAEYSAQALGKIGRTEPGTAISAIPALIEATRSAAGTVRIASLWAIEGIAPDLALEALIDAAQDPLPGVRDRAIRALARCNDERATRLLIAALPMSEGDPLARPIVTALARAADPASAPSLKEALSSADRRTANLIGRALGSLDRADLHSAALLHSGDPMIRRVGVWACTQRSHEYLDRLMTRALQDEDRRVRQRAAEGLGRVGGPGSGELLIPMLDDPSHHVRAAAVSSLGRLGLEESTPHVTRVLTDENATVRLAAEAARERLLGA